MTDPKRLEWRVSISLDNPEDVDYLYAWALQAQDRIRELEEEVRKQFNEGIKVGSRATLQAQKMAFKSLGLK